MCEDHGIYLDYYYCTDYDSSCYDNCKESDSCFASCHAACEKIESDKRISCATMFDCELQDPQGEECYNRCVQEQSLMCHDEEQIDCTFCFENTG